MRQVHVEHNINIAVNGCSGFATSTQKGPSMAMLISHSRCTYLINSIMHLNMFSGTFFLTHESTDYTLVNYYYSLGHEIASESIS